MIKDQRKPKRPWSTQKDGGLWRIFSEIAQTKMLKAYKLAKSKVTPLKRTYKMVLVLPKIRQSTTERIEPLIKS